MWQTYADIAWAVLPPGLATGRNSESSGGQSTALCSAASCKRADWRGAGEARTGRRRWDPKRKCAKLDNNLPTGLLGYFLIALGISGHASAFARRALQRIHKEPFHILICCNLCSPQAPSGASFRGTLLIFMCSLDNRRMYFRVLVFFKGDGIISPTVGRKSRRYRGHGGLQPVEAN